MTQNIFMDNNSIPTIMLAPEINMERLKADALNQAYGMVQAYKDFDGVEKPYLSPGYMDDHAEAFERINSKRDALRQSLGTIFGLEGLTSSWRQYVAVVESNVEGGDHNCRVSIGFEAGPNSNAPGEIIAISMPVNNDRIGEIKFQNPEDSNTVGRIRVGSIPMLPKEEINIEDVEFEHRIRA